MNKTDIIVLGVGLVAGVVIVNTVTGGSLLSGGFDENKQVGFNDKGPEVKELQRLINEESGNNQVSNTGTFDLSTKQFFDGLYTYYMILGEQNTNPYAINWRNNEKVSIKLFKENKP